MRWKNIAIKLWRVLDDIDSAADIYKPEKNDEYIKYICGVVRQRFSYIGSDGYNLKRMWVNHPKKYRESVMTIDDKPYNSDGWKILKEKVLNNG